VQIEAERLGQAVRSPVSLRNAEAQADFAALNADVAVVAAYGLILPQAVLDAPRHGCLNIHASLLPRWRGAAPIHRAVMAGDAETGVTIMQMEAGLDTGPMLHKVAVPVGRKTTGDLFAELGAVGAAAMVAVLADLSAFPPVVQDDSATIYAPKIDKAEGRIDWSQDADMIERKVRGLAPFPGAWFELNGERVKVVKADILRTDAGEPGEVLVSEWLEVGTGTLAICLTVVQPAGKGSMHSDAFLRGRPVAPGTLLG
jgi:methionyl-tRNA formyltransferase